MLTVGSRIRGFSTDLDYQAQGVMKHDGYVIFVPGLLDDEEAIVEITKIKKRYAEAKIIEIIKPSKYRRDDHEMILGSMDMVHMTEEKQRLWQIKTTQETLFKITGIKYPVLDVISDDRYRYYRNKSVFHVMDQPVLSLGLYQKGFYELIRVDHFSLSDQKTNEILKVLSGAKIEIDPKVLRHIVMRTNPNGESLVTLVAQAMDFTGKDQIVACLKAIYGIKGITLNLMDQTTAILSSNSVTLFGENLLRQPLLNLEVFIDDRSFYQINPIIIQKAYQIIKDHLTKEDIIIDAYSGVGSIGYYILDRVKHIYLIESNHESIQNAARTKDAYKFTNVEIIEGRAEDMLSDLVANVLIVDPPRSGLNPSFSAKVLEKGFEKIFYLSCDVKTLARDLIEFSDAYSIEKIYPLKMFYQTSSLETLVILSKRT